MKYLITTLNSKYIHTSLAIRCLYKSVCDRFDVSLHEYTINDNINYICGDIYRKKADVICFSCYIWNYDITLNICENLKKANPELKIVLGGPEVTYNAYDTLLKHDFIDAVMFGEGELTVCELFDAYENNLPLKDIDGVGYRENNGNIVVNNARQLVEHLDELPFVYDDSIDEYKNKLIYYETSRGCPFSCSYCLSGERGKVRYLGMDRIKSDIDFFIQHNVPLVKLVDRTFNANPRRAKEIFEYIINNSKDTRFHMELAGDLLDDETLKLLSKSDEKLFQFEIGVQTTNMQTMHAINRKIKWDSLKNNILRLLNETKIHIHLDLIAGLPYENLESFAKSFNDVVDLKPHVVQLGFLKLLKGSKIRLEENEYGYKYTTNSPYEVISNDFMSYDDLLLLHNIEIVFEKYYNSGAFKKTLDVLYKKYNDDYFALFFDLSEYFEKNGLFKISLSKNDLYDALYEYCCSINLECKNELKYDYITGIKSHNTPNWCKIKYNNDFVDKCYEVLKNEEFKKKYLPHYYDVPAKVVYKKVRFETFDDNVLLFDFGSDAVIDVTTYFA